ncbi:MAG TPA: hypothetical protein VNU20_04735, partial [Candidatus Sulfotelmatobacter sp.]|nr:hypothetical protein [Candidatus Sulfotelmatobacter sp.]
MNLLYFIQQVQFASGGFAGKHIPGVHHPSERKRKKGPRMKKPMEVRGGAVLLLALLFIPFPGIGAQRNRDATENGPDIELKEFRLDELEARLRTMEPGPERDYFAGVLANRTGHIEESIQLLNGVLPAVRGSRLDRAEIAL